MSELYITGIGEEEKEILKDAADNVGMDLAEFCRTRMRAGYRLWDVADGSFDTYEMQARLEEDSPEPSADDPDPAEASKRDRFAAAIKENVPRNEEDAIPKDELIDLVARDAISDVLNDLLDDGELKYNAKHDGFVRVD